MSTKRGPALEYFSEHRQAFNKELQKHPTIAMRVICTCTKDSQGQRDEGEVIGTVASYFNIVIDGTYSGEELDKLYMILTHNMRDLRREIIVPPGGLH